jgi:hypothetical protein
VIAVPLGVVGVADMERTHSQQQLMDLLESVERYCWAVLTDLRNRGSVADYREIILILVSSIATKVNLGDRTTDDAETAVALLGMGHHLEIINFLTLVRLGRGRNLAP